MVAGEICTAIKITGRLEWSIIFPEDLMMKLSVQSNTKSSFDGARRKVPFLVNALGGNK